MKSLCGLIAAIAALAGPAGLSAAAPSGDSSPVPARRELWVPTQDLKTVLAKNPRAVLLTREQYETLLRDAKKNLPAAPEPPRRAVLASARYTAEISGDVADVQAEFTVNVLSDNWAEVPLRFGSLSLGAVKLDGEAALSASKAAAKLVIRGKGEHRITAELMLPVERSSGVNSLQLALPSAAATLFTINLPPDTVVDSEAPVDVKKTPVATIAGVAIPASGDCEVMWRSAGNAQQGSAIVFEEGDYVYSIDETRIETDLGITLKAALGSLPQSAKIKLPPGATPLQVSGGEVQKWNVDGGVLAIDFTPGDRKVTDFHVLVQTPSLDRQSSGTVGLPLPEVAGVRRVSGKFVVLGSRGIKVKDVEAGEGAVQGEGVFEDDTGRKPDFVSAWRFAVQPASIQAEIEKIKPRFSVDLDTLAQFAREEIGIERTLSLNGEEGEIFETSFTVPQGEELLSVRNEDGSEPDWNADGATVHIRWSEGLAAGRKRIFKIRSRMEPKKWPDTEEVALEDLKISGAEKVNGYLAVKADAMFRLETAAAKGLEPRDGRTTPVRGDFAWFRREAFELQVKVARRAPEVQSVLLGYALPVDGALDVNGQLNFSILHSGIRKFRIKVPLESAAQFWFDGDQIAERNLDGDTWTIVLQKETTGDYALKFHAMISYPEARTDFQVDIPNVEPLDVRQQSGTWAVEANTATEISFKSSGMNELDPSFAPALGGYLPRHHVIGVFGYLGERHALKLEGVRHESASILTAVADKLELDTALSTSGAERHQAVFEIRTIGDQFLDVTLPEGAAVWSLAVDDQPMKPVAEKKNVVRVQLPATLDHTKPTRVQLVYETRRGEWGSSGVYRLAAPRLDARIPIMQSIWHVWLPDGFGYTAFDSNLLPREIPHATSLALMPWKWLRDFTFPILFKRHASVVQAMSGSGVGPTPESATGPGQDIGTPQAKGYEVSINDTVAVNRRATEQIQYKLDHIIIPKIDFREATVREAIGFIKNKIRELDSSEPDPARRGVNVVLKFGSRSNNQDDTGARPEDARLTLSLTNVPLGEALRYIGNLSGMRIKTDPYAVTMEPLSEPSDTLITKEYKVPAEFFGNLTMPQGGVAGSSGTAGIARRQSSLNFLSENGVQFPPGASASYVASSGKLIVRNTSANLDLVDAMVGAPTSGAPAKVAGLLPMKLELDRSGREYAFEGFYSAESVSFHYVDWWTQARRGWIWATAGGIAFFAMGRTKPWRRLVWGILALTFIPLGLAPSWVGMCNALLIGWLIAFAIHQIARRLVFRTRFVEVTAV